MPNAVIFTINSLYYSIADFSVRDYAGGLADLEKGVKPVYREDPVRMLRAVRFAAKLNMSISPETALSETPITRLAPLLNDVPSARLFEESLKLLQAGEGYATYLLLCKNNLFQPLFPSIARYFTEQGVTVRWSWACLLRSLCYGKQCDVLDEACRTLAIPKRITSLIRDIWMLQLRMSRRQGKRAWKMMEHPKFRAAYDLLALRAEIENSQELQRLTAWWGEFQVAAPPVQKNMLNTLDEEPMAKNAAIVVHEPNVHLAVKIKLNVSTLDHGRVRKAERWGPRTLDLDILLFGSEVITSPRLTVPHYDMKNRPFMLVPFVRNFRQPSNSQMVVPWQRL
ncbi:unnamed protein product [Ranitomeya imitator]|uniref:2-amino-4-hydroxy-6-hydroxymethyldihydropteridine diphosphokinase n=1 Tax=Ranitomeya imitator TaxID=111125 RepID=A0ABN9M2C3_9NEOB|nr:unnamed protein product [Ranitomeya imitator]